MRLTTSFLLLFLLQGFSNWKKLDVNAPPPRYIQNLVRVEDQLFFFGGKNNTNDGFDDLWTWRRGKWVLINTGATKRWDHGFAFHRKSDQIVLFGGRTSGRNNNRIELGDTWVYHNNLWSMLNIDGPEPRSSFAIAYHSESGQLILFGGRNGAKVFDDTWAFNGTSWYQLGISGPEGRMGHSLVHDRKTNQLILFGGHNGKALLGDTWVFDGSVWKKSNTNFSPSPRMAHAMEFDDHGTGILYGGWTGETSNETWRWRDNEWRLVPTGPSSVPILGHAIGYDDLNNQFIVFGGSSKFGEGFNQYSRALKLND